MTSTTQTHGIRGKDVAGRTAATYTFLLDKNFGLPVEDEPLSGILKAAGIGAEKSTDLPAIDRRVGDHGPDFAYIPIADYHRLFAGGDRHYRGLAIATSKFTGLTNLPSVLVVRRDDSASSLRDLEGARYGYINKSCSSSYFPPFVMLYRDGKRADEVLDMVPTAAWQGQIDALVEGGVRATMVPEDVWRTTPSNADTTKVIDRYDAATPALIIARAGLNEVTCRTLLDALVAWVPPWMSIYGAFRPFYYADVHAFFHDLDQLPADMLRLPV